MTASVASRLRGKPTGLPLIFKGSLPLLMLVFLWGLPVGRDLVPAEQQFAQGIYQETLEQVTTPGYERTYVNVIIRGGFYLLAGFFVLRAYTHAIATLKKQWAITALTLLVGASVFWAALPIKAGINFCHNVGILLVALAAALHYRSEPSLFVRHVGYALGFNIVLHVAAVAALPMFGIDYTGRWQGMTTHPNTFGAIAFCALWSNALAWHLFRDKKRNISLLFVVLAVLVLWGTQSRTALICSIFAAGAWYGLQWVKGRDFEKGQFLIVSITLLSITLILFMIFGLKLNPTELTTYIGRTQDFSGRTNLWQTGLQIFWRKPWTGYGFDDHAGVIANLSFGYMSFHNGYLDLLISGGLLSLTLFFLFSKRLIKQLIETAKKETNYTSIFSSFVLTVFIYNFMEGNLISPRNMIWVIFLSIAFLLEFQHQWPGRNRLRPTKP